SRCVSPERSVRKFESGWRVRYLAGDMEQQILLVEDDAELREAVQHGLREEGFECRAAAPAARFPERVAHHPRAGLVIDTGLPDADGRDLCQAVRARGVTTPVVFLTARDALPDRLSGV